MMKVKLKWMLEKSIPIIRKRELEAFIPGNGREQGFPLTPVPVAGWGMVGHISDKLSAPDRFWIYEGHHGREQKGSEGQVQVVLMLELNWL